MLYSKALLWIVVVFCVVNKVHQTYYSGTLFLVHILFRHGERTPQRTYPKDIHKNESYFPYGFGELTNKGRSRMYDLGVSLKRRYEKFWGSAIYNQSRIEARSSSFARTRMSCNLVMAGMFQPSTLEMWNKDLNWQPTLCDYVPQEEDYMFLSERNCKVLSLKKVEMEKDRIMGKFNEYNDLFEYLSEKSGMDVTTPAGVTTLYDILRCQNEMNMQMPDWSNKVFPYPMSNLSVLDWDYFIKTFDLKRLGGGILLKTIVDNTQKKINDTEGYDSKKIFIYSGHDSNIVPISAILNIYERKIMPYGATILIEIHRIDKKYIVKVYVQDRNTWTPRYVPLPECKKNCTLEKFVEAYQKYFAVKEMCL